MLPPHERPAHCRSDNAVCGVNRTRFKDGKWLVLCIACGTAYRDAGYRVTKLPTGYAPAATCESASNQG